MNKPVIGSKSQAIIDLICAHTWTRERVDRAAIETAITKHLAELGLPPQPFAWYATAKDGYSAADSAAWSAAESAARSAAESALAETFPHPETAKLAAIWLPMADAFDAGLWVYWITPTDVICVEQPSLHISDNRLHRVDGPAVDWPAGEQYWFWRGRQVPQEWIEDRSSLTATKALKWSNIEQRRAAIEIVGWDSILSQLNAKTIDSDADPEVGTLLEVNIPDIGKERFLRVRCGTGRTFALPVPPNMRTALEAQAWTWGIEDQTFKKPEVRT